MPDHPQSAPGELPSHMSYSAIDAYQTCPRYFEYRYVKKIKTPKAAAALHGTAVHQTIQTWLIMPPEIRPPLLDLWAETWPATVKEWEDGGPVKWDFDREHYDLSGQYLLEMPIFVSRLNGLRLHPDYAPETKLLFDMPGVGRPIIGFIDLILEDGTPLDIKVTGKGWDHIKARSSLQPRFYMWGLRSSLHPLTFVHWVLLKPNDWNPAGGMQWIKTDYLDADIDTLLPIVQGIWSQIEAGIFPQVPNGHWKCNPKWCEYYQMCKGKS